MCGRFTQAEPPDVYAAYFDADAVVTEELAPSYNVAPTDPVYAVAEYDGRRLLGSFRWGLVPWFSKNRKSAARHINARMETVATKASFKDSLARRRCLIPADGFYEWERRPDGKLPHYIFAAGREPLALAGLWASWRDPETDDRLRTCTIVTGPPDALVRPIHDRMPVMLPREAWDTWLNPAIDDPDQLTGLLRSAGGVTLAEHPVASLVNSVKNNAPELIEPLQDGSDGRLPL